MNTRLLRRVAKHISEEPKRLVMGSFVQRKSESIPMVQECASYNVIKTHRFAPCGTAACIAGWAVILTDGEEGLDVMARAAALLDIGSPREGKSARLFESTMWPKKFKEKYYAAKRPSTRAKIAVARIEHFIKTKGAE